MEELLTPVSTSYRTSTYPADDLVEVSKAPENTPREPVQVSSVEDALEALRREPDYQSLVKILRFIFHHGSESSSFRITRPSPLSAQLVNVLVTETVPSYWKVFTEKQGYQDKKVFKRSAERKLLLSCLRCVTGFNAILARLKAFIQQEKEGKTKAWGTNPAENLELYLDLLEALLQGDRVVTALWNDVVTEPITSRKAIWREIVVLVGSGKILNIAAESASIINDSRSGLQKERWITNGRLYSRWLASNIIQSAKALQSVVEASWKPLSELSNKCLRLGYSNELVESILKLILGNDNDRAEFETIIGSLEPREQQTVLMGGLRVLSAQYLSHSIEVAENPEWWREDSSTIAAAAAYLEFLISKDDIRKSQLITWLSTSSGAGIGDSVGIRRAAIAVISDSKQDLDAMLEKSLQQFGDHLYIRHAPSIQQEVHCQILLLVAGYVYRGSPIKLSVVMRSSSYLSAVSNRLAASSERARFLGMIVGETFSSLVDKPEKRMDFKMKELQSTEAKWYKSLASVSDTIGSVEGLRAGLVSKYHTKTKITAAAPSQFRSKPSVLNTHSKILAIRELAEESEEEAEDELVPYAKPDSDEEDSDEDPTLVHRNKATAPVYIRDLIVYLRDSDSYDRQKLGLSTAPSLIRRKATFGTEVSAHVEELATLLVGIHDKFDIDDFQDMRLQGMIAILLSQPSKMGPWFSRTFFEGDYSVSQRASILTVLSVSARELGGFKEQDVSLTSVQPTSSRSFPSKLLPPKLHARYAFKQPNVVETLSQQLSNTMIQPLAASLADKATGPDVLKVRTFSSRLAVEAKRKPPTINALSAIVANSFFFPLTGRFAAHLKAYGAKNVIFEPYLLSSYLKALSLILHAGGTSTLQLPQMTSEFWDLLLSLRTPGQSDKSVGEAVMFGFLTVLEMNADQRRLAEVHGRELMETQRWVEGVFQRLGSGSTEDDKLKSLAAGVLLKIRDVVEKYQALLVGDVANF